MDWIFEENFKKILGSLLATEICNRLLLVLRETL